MANKLVFRRNKKYPNKLFEQVGEFARRLIESEYTDNIECLAEEIRSMINQLREFDPKFKRCKNITVKFYKGKDISRNIYPPILWLNVENSADNSVITITDYRDNKVTE